MVLLEDLGLVDKHPDVIKQEIESENELHCQNCYLKVKQEARDVMNEIKKLRKVGINKLI